MKDRYTQLRRRLIDTIKDSPYDDYSFQRGDCDAHDFKSYEAWLESLSDENLIDSLKIVWTYD